MKNKILFVVQRYGLEINGGAESYCRQLAEKLSDIFDVSVLTTCAEDYMTWENKYNEGIETLNNVTVIRKKTESIRIKEEFDEFSIKMNGDSENIEMGKEWMEKQGPNAPELIRYLKENKNRYDVIIFVTYLYYPTYYGLKVAPEKSILISTAHDEKPIYYSIFNEVFHTPKAILYLTNSEKRFVESKFKTDNIYSDVIGVGIDLDDKDGDENVDLKEKFNITDDFVLYLGRIDESKGCKFMIDSFIKYKELYNNNIKLVLAGKGIMEIPAHKDIMNLGFVSEKEKLTLLKKCIFLILPSEFESLSLSTLEAMYFSKPVLLNGKCEVLKEHAILSNGGLYFENMFEFIEAFEYMVNSPGILKKMGENGKKYILDNYRWNVVLEKINKAIEYIKIGEIR